MKFSKSGFTLMELLVYMAIVGIVVVIAGEAFSNSTKFRIRTDNMIKATQEAENVATLFKADVEQMGVKSSKEASGAAGASDEFLSSGTVQDVYMKATDADAANVDFSSYNLTAGSIYDELVFRRARFDDAGKFVAVEEVGWFVKENTDTLKRYCRTISGTGDNDFCPSGKDVAAAKNDAVAMANGVKKFLVTPAMPGVKSGSVAQVFPYCTAEPCTKTFRMVVRHGDGDYIGLNAASDGTFKSVNLTGFVSNYDNNTGSVFGGSPRKNQVFAIGNSEGAGSWAARCSEAGNHFTLEKNIQYELSFSMKSNADKSRMFVPGTDHMAVGFRTQDGAKPAGIDDFVFFPPTTEQSAGTRTMRFTVSDKIENVCIAFTFACFSPLVSKGKITISDLVLKKVETANYSFNYADSKEFPIKDREKVKAFKLELQVSRGEKNGASGETGIAELVVPTPSNGPKE